MLRCLAAGPRRDGAAVRLPPVSNRRVVDFGVGVGRRALWLYSLPEVASARQVFGVPSVSARFGTSPDVWNWAMWLLARLVPKSETLIFHTHALRCYLCLDAAQLWLWKTTFCASSGGGLMGASSLAWCGVVDS